MIFSAIQPLVRLVVLAAITAAALLLLGFAMQFVAAALIGIVVVQMLRPWLRHETTIDVPPAHVTPEVQVPEGFILASDPLTGCGVVSDARPPLRGSGHPQ